MSYFIWSSVLIGKTNVLTLVLMQITYVLLYLVVCPDRKNECPNP